MPDGQVVAAWVDPPANGGEPPPSASRLGSPGKEVEPVIDELEGLVEKGPSEAEVTKADTRVYLPTSIGS